MKKFIATASTNTLKKREKRESCNICGKEMTQEELDKYAVYECESCMDSYDVG